MADAPVTPSPNSPSSEDAGKDPYLPPDSTNQPPPIPTEPTPPVAPPPAAFTNMAPYDPGMPKRKSKRALLLALVLALFVGAGSVAAYLTFVATSPESRIKNAFAAMAELDSLAVDGKLTTSTGIGVDLNGEIDNKDQEVKLTFSAKVLAQTVVIQLLGKDDVAYIKIDGLAVVMGGLLGNNAEAISLFKELEKDFLRLDEAGLQELAKQTGQQLPVQSTAPSQLSEADQDKLGKLFEETEFFKVTENLPDKNITGISSTGYKVVLQAEGVRELVRGLRDIEAFRGALFASAANSQDLEQQLSQIKQSDLDKVPFEVWLQGDKLSQVVLDLQQQGASMRLEVAFSRQNEDFQIEIPTTSRPLNDVLKKLPGLTGSSASPSSLLPTTLQ